MVIELATPFNLLLSPEKVALNLALGLYSSEEATLEQAATIANIPQADFLKELGKRKIPFHYGIEEFDEDLQTIARFHAK